MSRIMGVSKEEAFEWTMESMVTAPGSVTRGEPATIRLPDGRTVDVWQNVEEAVESVFRMYEQSDED